MIRSAASQPRTGRTRRRNDRGSVTVWMATSAFVMIVVAGLAVDLGGQVHTQQLTRDVAAQAARAGAERVAAGPAVAGRVTRVDPRAATAAAESYLTAAGVDGSTSVRGAELVVRTRGTYRTIFLSIIGIDTLRVTGTSTARLIRTVRGEEQ